MTQHLEEEEAISLVRAGEEEDINNEVVPANASGTAVFNAPSYKSVAWRLYLSHFLSTWNSRVFEFGAVLYLTAIFPNTLMPMSVYAVARAASAIILSPAVGNYIDRNDRLKVVRLSIVSQRIAVTISCAVLLILILLSTTSNVLRYLLLAVLSALACVEKAGSIMNLVSVEKDWVVEIAAGDSQHLSALNAQMRRIDLLCKLAGPLVIALLDGFDTKVAIIANLVMNVASLPFEYFAIATIYKRCPALKQPKATPEASGPDSPRRASATKRFTTMLSTWMHQARLYIEHPAFLPSFALSLLYLTVLSFAGQMVAYLIFAGFSSLYVGLTRTAAVVFELSATWAAPLLMDRIGPIRAGAWFASWQTLTLAAGVALFWVDLSSFTAASCLVVGTILSRVGLRGFELAAQIIVQDEVEPEHRGSFSSTEASWQNLFELCAFASTIVFAKPEQFRWPVVISLASTAMASITYAWFVRRRRGHLVHLSDCIDLKRRAKGRNERSTAVNYELLNEETDSDGLAT